MVTLEIPKESLLTHGGWQLMWDLSLTAHSGCLGKFLEIWDLRNKNMPWPHEWWLTRETNLIFTGTLRGDIMRMSQGIYPTICRCRGWNRIFVSIEWWCLRWAEYDTKENIVYRSITNWPRIWYEHDGFHGAIATTNRWSLGYSIETTTCYYFCLFSNSGHLSNKGRFRGTSNPHSPFWWI